MSQVFFLLNRAHQINRLYGTTSDKKIQRPTEKNLARLPERTRALYHMLDSICEIASRESVGEEATLNDAQRTILEEFEKLVVQERFSADEAVKDPAVQVIRAIYADAAYFSGLKPLPQYTEKFPYELLFPSWLNLLSAVMLPRVGTTNRARLEGPQQVELFRYLATCAVAKGECGEDYVGFLTFIASRFDAPQCEQMLQRAIDLVAKHGEPIVRTLKRLDACTTDGNVLKQRFGDYLIVKYSRDEWEAKTEFPITDERPSVRALPAPLNKRLDELEGGEDYDEYCNLLHNAAAVVYSHQPISIEFTMAMAKKPTHLPQMLHWIVTSAHPPKLLTEASQTLLATAIALEEPEEDRLNVPRIANFVTRVMSRSGGISEAATEFFKQQFLVGADNRKTLLDACESDAKLQKIAAMLQDRAGKTDSNEKFINLLSCVTVLDQLPSSLEAQVSLNALQAVIDNRSIGNKELQDIIRDLQKYIGTALQALAAPLSVAAEKSERLVTLYLTLNEVGQTLFHSGKVDNFSVVRAKYSRLSNLE